MARIVLDRGAYAGDVHVDRTIEGLERLAAHEVHQLLACQHATGTLGDCDQQLELVRRQRASLAIDPYHTRGSIDLEPTDAQRLSDRGRSARRSSASMRASSSRGSKGLGR